MPETKNVSNKGCGVPDRNKSRPFVIVAIAGAVVAVLSFILRMMASVGKGGRQVSWDDATMALVVLLAIPPTVFAPYRKFRAPVTDRSSLLTIRQW
jgi:hypothetical protein